MHEITIQTVPYTVPENRVIQVVVDHYRVDNMKDLFMTKYELTGRIVLIYLLYLFSPASQAQLSRMFGYTERHINFLCNKCRHTSNTSVIKAINQIIKEL